MQCYSETTNRIREYLMTLTYSQLPKSTLTVKAHITTQLIASKYKIGRIASPNTKTKKPSKHMLKPICKTAKSESMLKEVPAFTRITISHRKQKRWNNSNGVTEHAKIATNYKSMQVRACLWLHKLAESLMFSSSLPQKANDNASEVLCINIIPCEEMNVSDTSPSQSPSQSHAFNDSSSKTPVITLFECTSYFGMKKSQRSVNKSFECKKQCGNRSKSITIYNKK